MKRLIGVWIAATLTALAACGDGGAEVRVSGFRFQPKQVTVAAGEPVTWKQQDDTTHTITTGTPNDPTGQFDHRDFGRGETFAFTFEQAGTVPYFCAIHPEGMRGTVEIE
jgi:plastocyanin